MYYEVMNPKKLARKVLPKRSITFAEESYRKGRVFAFQAAKGFPARGLRVIAITGTNGKTTTASYINAMLKSAGHTTALFSTAQIEMLGKVRLNRTHRTVPITGELVAFLAEARQRKVDFVVLEVTSQALHQHKIVGIPVEVAVMTNLTQDHLDYHKTMEAYAAAKARLFNTYLKPKYSLLNRDDQWFEYFKRQAQGMIVSYGTAAGGGVVVGGIDLKPTGSEWTITEHGVSTKLSTSIPGAFNVMNATAAACVGKLVGLSLKQIAAGIASLESVPGRMERVSAGQKFTVLVDYAHTPDALKNVLQAARQLSTGKVRVVFGATGDRDKAKRPIMGQVAAGYADVVYLTDDETYTEDPEEIRAAVRDGLEAAGAAYQEIPDRTAAITKAFKDAKANDVVVLAGIGHQDSRNMGGKLVAWNEAEVASKVLSQV